MPKGTFKKNTAATIIGIIIIAAILVLGTIWTGVSARQSTEEAVHSVSLFYMDELAGRREQVVANNLQNKIDNIFIGIGLMDENDLASPESLQAYQARMKKLYGLEKFAFVDSNGLIYTSTGVQDDIEDYLFDYKNLTSPQISLKDTADGRKTVIIAVPTGGIPFNGDTLGVCFMEIDMKNLLEGVSLQSDNNDTTFCNIYTKNGTALTDMVLGGLASEDNLLEAMEHAEIKDGYSLDQMFRDFEEGNEGVISFNYDGIDENLYYVPIEGTDWMLTYLIRESVISDQIGSISDSIIVRSFILTLAIAAVLIIMFTIIIRQNRHSAKLLIEKETSEAENRVKQQELEQRLELQEKLLEQEKQRAQQDNMITALASDYRSVYYVDLDEDQGVCYRDDPNIDKSLKAGEHFDYLKTFSAYADSYVEKEYKDGFLQFIDPENVRKGLEKDAIIVYRYRINRNGHSSYEMLRMAGVRHAADRDDHLVHAVGVGFTDIDAEMRENMARNQALSDALAAAEEANKAKTVFLSNMSHEIRTPMNAIIGLDSIALNDPDVPEKTKDYLEKIGSSAHHLLTLINDILDMSRIESGKMIIKSEEFSFSKLLEQINTMISGQCSNKGLRYRCHIYGEVDDYYISDDAKLRQVLLNILGNAVKFTPEGGEVSFNVEKIANYEGKTTMRFTIKDNGIGMDKEFLPRIFDAFSQEDGSSTSKYGSTGLGMAITKNIVDLMNGDISVDSEKGVGTTFIVTMTFMDSERTADGNDGDDINPGEMSVLVIDDDTLACEHARLVLEKAGISSDIASSGEEAIEMVRIRHARREPYNLILVDWKMPVMDGVETTRRIRSIVGNESAIIILTAYRWDDILEEALGAGVDSFISKPVFAANVLDEFRQSRRKKRALSGSDAVKADLTGKRVLLAEDVPVNAEIIKMALDMKNMEVDIAGNGRIAVDKYMENPEGYYDAVLMDMRMPEMDGLTASGLIRKAGRSDSADIPIIALTANAFDEDVQRSLQAGLNAHLTKPVHPEDLYEALESFIKEKDKPEQ